MTSAPWDYLLFVLVLLTPDIPSYYVKENQHLHTFPSQEENGKTIPLNAVMVMAQPDLVLPKFRQIMEPSFILLAPAFCLKSVK